MQKFENVDILKSLKAIMQTHTEHFQSDFDIDIKTLKQAAKSQNPEDKKRSVSTPSRQGTRYLPTPWS